jgi:hypothetical protein
MVDKYLTHEFRDKNIDDLVDFLSSLDANFHWKGGLLPQYSNDDVAYFFFWEESQQNLIFAKCFKELKMNKLLCCNDIEIAHQEVTFNVISVSSSKQEDILSEENVIKELATL